MLINLEKFLHFARLCVFGSEMFFKSHINYGGGGEHIKLFCDVIIYSPLPAVSILQRDNKEAMEIQTLATAGRMLGLHLAKRSERFQVTLLA